MRVYDQIIFDELTAGRPILLNEVGYLKVVTKAAELKNNKSVTAPRRIVVYDAEAPEGAHNVVDILAAQGTDIQAAWDQYNGWLAESRKEGELIIEGVGKVTAEYKFIPTKDFDKVMNPGAEENITVKPHSKAWIWIVVVVLLLLIVAFLRFCTNTFAPRNEEPVIVEQPAPAPEPQPVQQQPEKAPDPNVDPVTGLRYPLEGMHYVVGGVFDIPENADKYIEELKKTYPESMPEKFAYPGVRPGRTMVTVFASDKRSEALDVRRDYALTFFLQDFWLYPEAK